MIFYTSFLSEMRKRSRSQDKKYIVVGVVFS